MADWVAVSCDINDDPKVIAFARSLKIITDSAVARLVQLWGKVARHSIETGDLSTVDDDTLEVWAGWRGKRGIFAMEFRRTFATDGVINGWWNWNGRHLKAARLERERKRIARGHSAPVPPTSPGPSGGQSTGQGGGPEVDNTGPDRTRPTTPTALADSAPWQKLASRLVGVRENWQVEQWLNNLPASAKSEHWVHQFNAWLDGLGFPGGKCATPEGIVAVCRDWDGIADKALSPRFFRKCVLVAMRDAETPLGRPSGNDRETKTILAAGAFVKGAA